MTMPIDNFDDEIPARLTSLVVEGRTVMLIHVTQNESDAIRFLAQWPHCALRVVMGDCPWYWVVTQGDAEHLERAGYEQLAS